MSTEVAQNIDTLLHCLEAMAPNAGGSVPATSDPAHACWVSWVQRGQEDAAKRGFWRRLLVPVTVTVPATETMALPDNFHKVNGVYSLFVNGVDWAEPNNEDGQRLYVFMDPTDATWKVRFMGFTPTAAVANSTLWYFYNPPKPEDDDDPLWLDGEMIMFYALKEYFRTAGELGSLDDARIEYENRFQENLNLEVLPSRQELAQMSGYMSHLRQDPTERQFYGGRGGRSR